eukprot:TRINITY_DN2853_c0_g1_i1.p1 TRINITY_DN2853_c0_g1~~TRINITY_DN2853_c0_g1_i1.p1  ORF type:complete len:387 (+),score=51.72 TRINITY_DN2853_c0_g1_i1:80-1240(+)
MFSCSQRLVLATCLSVVFGSSNEHGFLAGHAMPAVTEPRTKYYDEIVSSLPSLKGKCVAITGTTSGLGYWAAVATVKKKPACLIMLNRKSSRSVHAQENISKQAPVGVLVTTVSCDLQNLSSVREAATGVQQTVAKFGGLDVLALNAGIMTQPDKRTADGFDVTMQTNHLSHFLLTKLLMPSLQSAAAVRGDVRIVTQSSMARGSVAITAGGGPFDQKYYLKSAPQTLGGDGAKASRERYHQSKFANIVFAMALHSKFKQSKVKALSAAPGFSITDLNFPAILKFKWIQDLIALSAPDGSCSLLTAMFSPSAKSGDFYEPKLISSGPPLKVISEGVPKLDPLRWILGLSDDDVCSSSSMSQVWNASEAGLGEKFIIPELSGSFVIV